MTKNNEFTLTTPKKKTKKNDSLEWDSYKEETTNKTVTNSFIDDMVSRSKGLIEAISKRTVEVDLNEKVVKKNKKESFSEIEMTKIFSPRRKQIKLDSFRNGDVVLKEKACIKNRNENDDSNVEQLILNSEPIQSDSKIIKNGESKILENEERSNFMRLETSENNTENVEVEKTNPKIIEKNNNSAEIEEKKWLESQNNHLNTLKINLKSAKNDPKTINISRNEDIIEESIFPGGKKKKVIPEVLNAMKTLEELENNNNKRVHLIKNDELNIKRDVEEIIALDLKIRNERIVAEKNNKIDELLNENSKLKTEIEKIKKKNERIVEMRKKAQQDLNIEIQRNISKEIPVELDAEEKKRLAERGILLVEKMCDEFQQMKNDLNSKHENIKLEMRGLKEEVFAYKNMVKELLKKIKKERNAEELVNEIKKELK